MLLIYFHCISFCLTVITLKPTDILTHNSRDLQFIEEKAWDWSSTIDLDASVYELSRDKEMSQSNEVLEISPSLD